LLQAEIVIPWAILLYNSQQQKMGIIINEKIQKYMQMLVERVVKGESFCRYLAYLPKRKYSPGGV